MKIIEDNFYIDLESYADIYQELVFVRNEAIRWLDENMLLNRTKRVQPDNFNELSRHKMALAYRMSFKTNVEHLLNRLYSHDAIEALYDFQNVDMGNWSKTEANYLEKELNRLQFIIGKLEVKYQLQYKLRLSYEADKQSLLLNTVELLSLRGSSIKHRLMTALFSKPKEIWDFDDIEKYFRDNFGYTLEQLSIKQVLKAAADVSRDVSRTSPVRDFLLVNQYNLRINPKYLS